MNGIEQDEFGAVQFYREEMGKYSCFDDFYPKSNKFTYHYIWCLYAIVWAIQKYDDLVKKD